MTHPLTPREKVLMAICKNKGRTSGDLADAILTALASGSGDHSGGVTDMIGSGDHAELARLSDMSACVIARHGRAPSLDDLPSDPENWSGFAHAKILTEHRATLLAENAALRASVVKANDGFEEYERKFYLEQQEREEAERKLAEAETRLERWEPKPFCQPSVSSSISKEAERGGE